jgi:hypothetical protein
MDEKEEYVYLHRDGLNSVDRMVVFYHVVPLLQVEGKCKLSPTSKNHQDMIKSQITPEWEYVAWMLLNIDTLQTLSIWMTKNENSVHWHYFHKDRCGV